MIASSIMLARSDYWCWGRVIPCAIRWRKSSAPSDVCRWHGVPLRVESKWKNDEMRPEAVRGRLIEELVQAECAFVIDDAESGEAADVVEILQGQHELIFRLYHCKYAHGQAPGIRMADLYEVCGQAIRSSCLRGS